MWNFYDSQEKDDNGLADFGVTPTDKTIDVYIFGKWNWEIFEGSLSLEIQLAHICHCNSKYASTTFRLIQVIGDGEDSEKCKKDLELLIKETRINAVSRVVIISPETMSRVSGKTVTSIL